jgi:DNA-binding CsgD family transcriptional regulator
VLQLAAEEGQVKEIAAVLDLSPKTVEFHKYRIMDLLGVRTVADLIRYAIKRGIVA